MNDIERGTQVMSTAQAGDELLTNEAQPRIIRIAGRSAMSSEGCWVGMLAGRRECVWVYPTGYVPDLGPNVFVAKQARERKAK